MAITNLNQRWVLVTGAASGIGYETARAFAKAGAVVVLTDVQTEALALAQQAITADGASCESHVLDVTDHAAVTMLANQLLSRLGPPGVVVNNAGVGFLGPFLHTPLAAWRRVLDVNLMGMVHVCQAFLPAMLEADAPSHLVNVASAAGLHPAPNLSAYAASKHAVMGLHDTLVMELHGKQVGLTVVCPGVINTPIVRNRSAVADVVPDAQLDRIANHYERHGAMPVVVGQRIVRAVQNGDDFVLVGPTAKQLHLIKRLSRPLASLATRLGCRQNGYAWRYES